MLPVLPVLPTMLPIRYVCSLTASGASSTAAQPLPSRSRGGAR